MGMVTSYKKMSRKLEFRLIEGTKIKTVKISFEGLTTGRFCENLHPQKYLAIQYINVSKINLSTPLTIHTYIRTYIHVYAACAC